MKFEHINGTLCLITEPVPEFNEWKYADHSMAKPEPKPLPFEHVKKDDMILCSDGKERKVVYVGDKPDRLNHRLWFNLKDEYGVNTTYHLDGTMQRPDSHPDVTYTLVKIAPKPLLADAKVGWLCKRRDGTYDQIADTNYTNNILRGIPHCIKMRSGMYYPLSSGEYINFGNGIHVDNPNDIISTEPLALEGSAEWALQMLLLGKKVTKQHLQDSGNVYCCFCDRLRCVQEFNCGTLQIMVTPEIWVKTVDKCGWKLYEPAEPCPACNGTEVKPAFEVGALVQRLKFDNAIYRFLGNAEGYKNLVRLQNIVTKTIFFCGADTIDNHISPSEVSIKIGCLEGTVEKQSKDYFRITNGDWSGIIPFAMLDTPTRELVQSLLKAQEEKQSD